MAVYVPRRRSQDPVGLPDRGYARRLWEDKYDRAMSSGIEPLLQFSRRLKPSLAPSGTILVECINNRIKVFKRMAYGFRADHCLFLKIGAAFLVVRRRTKKKARRHASSGELRDAIRTGIRIGIC
ncbi:transposase [Cupriavidus sp. H39]|uniref:transposase n=1 Tax=Cupriavidus sp. H39 TaxID=3401635 RepID=UPI003D003400